MFDEDKDEEETRHTNTYTVLGGPMLRVFYICLVVKISLFSFFF